jgi:hypothetical protein
MTDKQDQLRLSAGTVPDPFGLAWDLTRQASDEEVPDPDSAGSAAIEQATQDRGAVTDAPQVETVPLGELD